MLHQGIRIIFSSASAILQLIVLVTYLPTTPLKGSSAGELTIYASQGVQVFVTDPQGRRIGYVNGSIVREIPNASYFDEQIRDDNPSLGGGDRSVPLHHVLTIPSPQDALYNLTITGVTPGTAKVEIYRYTSSGNPQSKQLINILVAQPGQVVTQPIKYSSKAGDLNGDGSVDCTDVGMVRAVLGKRLGDLLYDPVCDLNSNGVIDIRDLAIVSQKLPTGTRCQ